MTAFLQLELARATRNRRYLVMGMAFPAIFYLLYGGVVAGQADLSIGGTTWRTYFLVSMTAYAAIATALSSAVVVAQERESGWTRQLRVTPLPATAYVVAKLGVSYLVTLPSIGLVLLVGAVINGVRLPIETWVILALALACGALPFAALGVLFGLTLEAASAQGLTAITSIGLAFLGGLWIPLASLPEAIGTIAEVLPSSHFANLGWGVVGGGGVALVDVAVLCAYLIGIGGLVAWRWTTHERAAS
jgi:ABC-2 type transport system permease protein